MLEEPVVNVAVIGWDKRIKLQLAAACLRLVAAAYGWPADLSEEQILERLLALNLERAKQEEAVKPAKPKRTNREKVAEEMI